MNRHKTTGLVRIALFALVWLSCGASLSVFGQNTYQVSRSWGSSTNDWADIGSFANTGISQYVVFTVQGHWCGSIISAQFRYDDIAYTGSSSNWMELPASNGGKVYNGTQPVAIDIKRASPSSTSDPILARIRNLQGMCGGTSLNVAIDTNTTFTATTSTGSGGTVDSGYAASDVGWKFPVTTDAHAASTNGLFVLNTGNVGIGTTSPNYKLEANSSTLADIAAIATGTGDSRIVLATAGNFWQWGVDQSDTSKLKLDYSTGGLSVGGATVFTVQTNGNVGIGATSPNSGAKLDVRGGVSVNQTQSTTQRGAGLDVGWTGSGNADVYLGDYTNGWAVGENGDASLRVFKTSGATLSSTPVTIQAGGNVGVGTTSPTATLHLKESGTNPVAKIEYSNATTQALQFVNTAAGGKAWSIGDGIGTTPGNFGIYNLTNGSLAWAIDQSGVQSVQTIHSLSSSSSYFTGKLGIGTQLPGALVATGGGIGAANQIGMGLFGTSRNKPGFFLGSNESGSPFSSTAYFGFQGAPVGYVNDFAIVGSADPGTHRYLHIGYNTNDDPTNSFNPKVSIDTFGGNVGIGTTYPLQRLSVNYSSSNALPGMSVSDTSAGGSAGVTLNNTDASGNSAILFNVGNANKGRIKADNNGRMTLNGSGFGNDLTIDSSGNVGIGQPNPTYRLDVSGTAHISGNVTVDGNLSAKYQDVAEWVRSSEQLSAGTVVVLDAAKSNQVTSSTVSYDTRVAGVVSEQPGIALGEKSDGKVLVATTGRVRVKVDATKGPIHVGDLLVTSDIPGLAMKSEPMEINGRKFHQPGTLIGKVLEPLEKGKGEILVLLSLQ